MVVSEGYGSGALHEGLQPHRFSGAARSDTPRLRLEACPRNGATGKVEGFHFWALLIRWVFNVFSTRPSLDLPSCRVLKRSLKQSKDQNGTQIVLHSFWVLGRFFCRDGSSSHLLLMKITSCLSLAGLFWLLKEQLVGQTQQFVGQTKHHPGTMSANVLNTIYMQ